MMYGCSACRHIYDLAVFYAEASKGQHCPNCGEGAVRELGEAPAVTESDGRFYMVDKQNCMGPYANPLQAQQDLPKWFGVDDAPKEEARINNRYEVIDGGKSTVSIPVPGPSLGRSDEQGSSLPGQSPSQDGK